MRTTLRYAATWAICVVLALSAGASDGDLPRGAIAVLMYHHVDDEVHSRTVVSPEVLEEHIKAVLEAGFDIMTLSDLSRWLSEPDSRTSGVIFTFDDGYDSFYYEVFPLLCRYRVPASCFLIVSSSEAPGSMSSGAGAHAHVSFEQIIEMLGEGLVELGSHSYDGHRYVATERGSRPCLVEPLINEDYAGFLQRVQADLVRSRQVVRSMTGTECRYFSYPFGWVTSTLRDQVSLCGFDLALTTRSGAITIGADRYSLPRITVLPEMTGADLVDKIVAEMVRAQAESPLYAGRSKDEQPLSP